MKSSSSGKKAQEKPDFWSTLPRWKVHLVCLAIIAIVPIFLHSPSVTGGRVMATSDIIQWRAGAESLIQHRDTYNEQAQWANNMFSGMPAYVISNLERFPHIDTLVTPLFSSIFPYIEYLILLTGAYVFLLLMGYRPFVSVIGAFLIGLTTYIPIIVGAGHNTKFIAYAYIPWIFAGYKMMTSRTRFTSTSLLAGFAIFLLAFMLHVRAGHPQVTYYFLFLLAIWWAIDGYDRYREGQVKLWGMHTVLLVIAGFLALFSVIEQYWAVYEYSAFSIRGGSDLADHSGLDRDYAFVWSQGWMELLTLVIPNLFGGGEFYWGPKPVTSGPHYFGAIGVIFFVIGLVVNRKSHLRIFLTTGILAVLFSLGKHFSLLNDLMFEYFPLFNKFRTPEMWLLLAVFCFTIPALDGLSWVIEKASGKVALSKNLNIAGGAVLLIGLVFSMGSQSILKFEKQGERAQIANQIAVSNQVPVQDPRVAQAVDRIMKEQLIPGRLEVARNDSYRFLMISTITLAVIAAVVYGKISVTVLLPVLVLITAFDMVSVGKRYVPDHAYQPKGFTAERVIESRKRPVDDWLQNEVKTEEGWSYRVFPLSDNPFNNAIPAYFYPSIGGYSGAKLAIYQDMIDQALFTGPMGINVPLLSLLNVKYIIYTAPVPGFDVAYQNNGLYVLENRNVLPKAFFVNDIRSVGDPKSAMEFIRDTDVDFGETAVVLHGQSVRFEPDSESSVSITRYNAHQIYMDVSRSTEGFLLVSEIFYPDGWRAYIGDEEIEIWRTNYLFRGLYIPAGEYQIRFEYSPEWYHTVRLTSNIANWIALILLMSISGVVAKRQIPKQLPSR